MRTDAHAGKTINPIKRFLPVAAAAVCALALAGVASAQGVAVPNQGGSLGPIVPGGMSLPDLTDRENLPAALQIVVLLTVLSLAPALLVMVTSFTRIVIVLSLLRQAMGTASLPPNQVITGLALFMTFVVMGPTWAQIHDDALRPYLDGELSQQAALDRSLVPVRDFMIRQIEQQGNEADVLLFHGYASETDPETWDEVAFTSLVPAFMLSELKTAFLMGFKIYLPFLVVDMVVSAVLISMGMMMLPPVLVSLPFKLLLFVLVDGWRLVDGVAHRVVRDGPAGLGDNHGHRRRLGPAAADVHPHAARLGPDPDRRAGGGRARLAGPGGHADPGADAGVHPQDRRDDRRRGDHAAVDGEPPHGLRARACSASICREGGGSVVNLAELPAFAPGFAAAVFRLAGLMLFAPLFGSGRVPRRVKVLFAVALAVGLFTNGAVPAPLPNNVYALAMGLGGEIAFGLAMGMSARLTFTGAKWAGEAIGQQMGLGLGAVFNPNSDVGGGAVDQAYYLLTLFIFLGLGGHRLLVMGVYESYDVLPPLTVGVDADVLDAIVGLLMAATNLAVRLAAPMFVSMLAVDLCLGFIAKTMPQLNLLAAGLSLKALVGMAVLVLVMAATADTLAGALRDALQTTYTLYTTARS